MEPPEIDSAILFGSITMVSWGIWIVLGNAASETIDSRTAAAITYLVAAFLALGYIIISDAPLAVTARGGLLAAVAGLFAGVGTIATYAGLARGSTTIVTTVGAMYFVVAALIGMVVLGDKVTITRLTGIAFAALGVVLISQ